MMAIFTRNRMIGLMLALVVLAADKVSKWYVAGPLQLTQIGDRLDLLPFFDLTRVHNFGVSMGMFQATSLEMRFGLIALTALIALVVLVWMMRERKLGDIVGLAVILGGAIGNIHDRWTLGYVFDFADFHVRWIPEQLCLSYSEGLCRPFLIFNVADAAITVGVVIILARSLFLGEKDDNSGEDTAKAEN